MVDMLNEDRKDQAMDVAAVCATIINWSGLAKRSFKAEELMKVRVNG